MFVLFAEGFRLAGFADCALDLKCSSPVGSHANEGHAAASAFDDDAMTAWSLPVTHARDTRVGM
jgi:hypothetical protein